MAVEHSAVDKLAGRIAHLSSQQRALLSQKLMAVAAKPSAKILPRTLRDEAPLSFAQERLWVLAQLQPDTTLYTIAASFTLAGSLDRRALLSALNAIVQRHGILRTRFVSDEGKPRQVVRPRLELDLPFIDLSGLARDEQDSQIRRLAQAQAQAPFDLNDGPLLRVGLAYRGGNGAEAEHVLLFAVHHIVFDGWSIGIFMHEFASLYRSFRLGTPSPLSALAIQYADYAAWQREWLNEAILQKQTEYWRNKLKGLPPLLDLPTDRPRPMAQSDHGAVYRFVIPADVRQGLRSLSRQAGATLFMVLLAAFKLLLSRYSGRQDIFVGTPVANRTRSEIEGLIGFFVNTQVLRTDLSGNPRLAELLARVRATCLEAQSHQDLPFEKLVKALQPVRNLGHSPLFQVMFVLQNAPGQKLDVEGLRIGEFNSENAAAKFDLSLELAETDAGMDALFEYNTDLFDAATMVRMAGHYKTLLEGFTQRQEGRMADFPMLTRDEYRQLETWNSTDRPYSRSHCVHELFEAQAQRSPAAVAVCFADSALSYAKLNAKANQLAHFLRGKGIGPDALVGVHIERSLDMVVGLLGILKAGAAYVPLDTDYPRNRLAYMLEDAKITVLLTQAALLDRLPGQVDTVLCLDRDWTLIGSQPSSNPPKTATALNLAYVIYTSGSTGNPKGAGLAHQGVVNRLLGMQEQYGLGIGDKVMQKTPFSFDVSVWEFFWPLSAGAELVVAPPGAHKDAGRLAGLIQQKAVTTLHFVPSMLNAFLDAPGAESCRCVRRVICSGEAMPAGTARRFYEKLDAQLHNLYGPTEASIDVTAWPCEKGQTTVPIGFPVANAKIHLLDRQFNRVPVGVPGELHIGGVQLARGYLNKPGLTAERFVPDPYGGAPGARLYKTGDLARYRGDGSIEYLGRIDHQVKIRGFRIELGEIEAKLGEYPGIQETLAVVREDSPGNPYLAAYFSTPDASVPAADSLRSFLSASLPDYMIPSCFIMLDSFPLNPNGKVDRQALPIPHSAGQSPAGRIAPRNLTETQLARLWEDLLGVESVGVHDSFFELGGNSLLVNQLSFKIEKMFGRAVSLRELFTAPTVAMQASLLAGDGQSTVGDEWIDLEAEARLDDTIYPLAGSAARAADPEAVLLTGATGFLGAFLASELLKQTRATVHCLVRADSLAVAVDKIRKNFIRYGLDTQAHAGRLVPVLGDIAQPLLGMRPIDWEALSREVDIVYHNAAIANFIQPYAMMKPANVNGTHEALRFACTGKQKPLHYISTVSIFGSAISENPLGFSERDFPEGCSTVINNGYAQTKWVAEKLVRLAQQRGVEANIYRPAMITGHSLSGAWNTDDFICRVIKACVDLGLAPEEEIFFNMVPVDFASRSIVYLSRQATNRRRTFHITNTNLASSKMMIGYGNTMGFQIKYASFGDWFDKARRAASESKDFVLGPFLAMLEAEAGEGGESQVQRYQCAETIEALAGSQIECPRIDGSLLDTYFRFLVSQGFLLSANT